MARPVPGREEIDRRDINTSRATMHGSPQSPPGNPAFSRLRLLSDEQLATHEERLLNDLDYLEKGIEQFTNETN
ncbi:hypothetical protein ACFPYI_00085 [Halomarina salina]|uniref:Uncharacterized protein n=1 Tax=Halomarina salina TaxID=1872699 RepID=A0ABD5RGN5_9EURY|nr:hypothetical protein [Halomarina salina]